MKKNMERARSEGKPKGSPSLEYIIDMFESEQVPGRFLRAYLGHVSVKIKGEIVHYLYLRFVLFYTSSLSAPNLRYLQCQCSTVGLV